MNDLIKKYEDRKRRHRRLRQKVNGVEARPRLAVSRSLRHISAQLVVDYDDKRSSKTLCAISSQSEGFGKSEYGGNIKAAEKIGQLIAEKAKALGIEAVVFDTGGRKYHGRVKALAEAARKAGLRF